MLCGRMNLSIYNLTEDCWAFVSEKIYRIAFFDLVIPVLDSWRPTFYGWSSSDPFSFVLSLSLFFKLIFLYKYEYNSCVSKSGSCFEFLVGGKKVRYGCGMCSCSSSSSGITISWIMIMGEWKGKERKLILFFYGDFSHTFSSPVPSNAFVWK